MTRRNHSAFGSSRERAVREILEREGWVVMRSAASRFCDLVAARAKTSNGSFVIGSELRLIEVKGTTRSPWVAFGPADRAKLAQAARMAGGSAFLAWWPPHGELQWIGEAEWPA